MKTDVLPLYSFKVKKVALIGVIITLIMVALDSFLKFFNLISAEKYFALLVFFLFVVISSEEKIKNDVIIKIRNSTTRLAFMYSVAVMIAVGLVKVFYYTELEIDILLIALMSEAIYIIVFYSQIVFGIKLKVQEEELLQNYKSNSRLYLIVTIAMVAIFSLLYVYL